MTAFSSVRIQTKPYVKHYLETHFGKPCRFPSGHFIGEHLNILLSRPVKDDNHKVVDYSDSVIIELSKTTFQRYGFGLTKTNRRNFNLVIENFIKSQIRAIAENILISSAINEDWKKRYEDLQKDHKQLFELSKLNLDTKTASNYRKYNVFINKRILEHEKNKIKEKHALQIAAYDCMGFTEEILAFDTIKQDFYRYRNSAKHCYHSL